MGVQSGGEQSPRCGPGRRLPRPGPDGARRQAAGVPGLRGHLAAAAGRPRRRAAVPHHEQRRRPPRRPPARRGGHRGLRGRPRDDRGLRRGAGRRGRPHQERDRGHQPRRVLPGQRLHHARGRAPGARAGRRGRRHRDGAPRQPRALAGAVPPDRGDAALVRRHRRRPARPGQHRADRPHPRARLRPHLQRARHRQPGDRARGPRPRGRRARRPRRLPVGARTCPSTCPRSASTSPCSAATRCSAPPGSA